MSSQSKTRSLVAAVGVISGMIGIITALFGILHVWSLWQSIQAPTSACPEGESRVAVRWTAPEATVTDIKISGSVDATKGHFTTSFYVNNMTTGFPEGMVVSRTNNSVKAAYNTCTPVGSHWIWSVSYTDSLGLARWSCEGSNTENGSWTVTVDGQPGPVPGPVSNGIAGCNHGFVQ